MKFAHTLAPVILLAFPAAAQVVTTQVGPDPAPLGGPVFASVTNNTDLIMGIGGCPWRILDASGALVYEPSCIVLELLVGSLGTINYRWDQTDGSGLQVPAGTYRFVVATPGGTFDTPFVVGGVDASLHLKGTPAIGTDVIGFGGRQVALSAPLAPGAMYWLGAAFASTPGIATCAGIMPLANDPLLAISLGGGVVTSSIGTLDSSGYTETPTLPLPDDLALVGLDFALAFVTFDGALPCPVTHISNALSLKVAPGAIPFP